MKENNAIFTFIFILALTGISSSLFLGGTISWRENRNKIRYIFRMTFELGTGPCGLGCSDQDIGKRTTAGGPFNQTYWTCLKGCSNNVTGSDLNYIVTALGDSPGWEQGENRFEQRMVDTIFTMSMTIPDILTNSGKVTLTTTVDTRVRNDTQSINASPVAALPPYTGLPFGCLSNVSLPVVDPDGDVIKCRWTKPVECGQNCNELPEAYIDENSCIIYLNVTNITGFAEGKRYLVSVTVEDFPRIPIKLSSTVILPNLPISSVPIQFYIDIVSSSSQCKPSTFFDTSNFPDDSVASYSFMDFHNHVDFIFPVYILSTRPNTTFVQSFSQHVDTTVLRNYSRGQHRLELYSKWRPIPQQLGENLLCVWGKDNEGVTSRKHCILGLIADSNECVSNPCYGAATCLNLYMKYTCICPPGFKGVNCQKRIVCGENPCLNNATCSSNHTVSCHCNKGTFKVHCPFIRKGFFGDFCQFEEQPCSSFPCKNGGRCSSFRGEHKCKCLSNFTGPDCGSYIVQNDVIGTQTSPLYPPLLLVLAGTILGCILLWICMCIISKRIRAKIQPKVKDSKPADLHKKNTSRIRGPKGKSLVLRQSLDY